MRLNPLTNATLIDKSVSYAKNAVLHWCALRKEYLVLSTEFIRKFGHCKYIQELRGFGKSIFLKIRMETFYHFNFIILNIFILFSFHLFFCVCFSRQHASTNSVPPLFTIYKPNKIMTQNSAWQKEKRLVCKSKICYHFHQKEISFFNSQIFLISNCY